MFTFLRKIRLRLLGLASADTVRKSLIGSSSFSRYLLYAIGEIALVVIGILIALQINNWNEERKEKDQINTYLKGLVEALEDDINYLNYTIQGNTFRTNCINTMILWSNNKGLSIPSLDYSADEDWNPGSLYVSWTNRWMNEMPSAYDRPFVEECFLRTSYGNIIVTNQFTIEEFKNSGLFSNIRSEELRRQINHYYSILDWQFSLWRETNYRQKIDEWESFLRNNYQINYSDISQLEEPIKFIKDHRDVQLQLERICIDAADRVNSAGEIRDVAKDLIVTIKTYIQEM